MLHALLFHLLLTAPTTDSVIICTGANSHVYHTTTRCYGLRDCHWHIKKLTVADAEQMHRTACKLCAKRKK